MAKPGTDKVQERSGQNHTETNSLEGEVLTLAFTSSNESDREGQKIHKRPPWQSRAVTEYKKQGKF